MASVIHWDLAGKCGFADCKNVKIKLLQILGDVQERKIDFIGYIRGDESDIVKGVNVLYLSKKNSKIISESERIRI